MPTSLNNRRRCSCTHHSVSSSQTMRYATSITFSVLVGGDWHHPPPPVFPCAHCRQGHARLQRSAQLWHVDPGMSSLGTTMFRTGRNSNGATGGRGCISARLWDGEETSSVRGRDGCISWLGDDWTEIEEFARDAKVGRERESRSRWTLGWKAPRDKHPPHDGGHWVGTGQDQGSR